MYAGVRAATTAGSGSDRQRDGVRGGRTLRPDPAAGRTTTRPVDQGHRQALGTRAVASAAGFSCRARRRRAQPPRRCRSERRSAPARTPRRYRASPRRRTRTERRRMCSGLEPRRERTGGRSPCEKTSAAPQARRDGPDAPHAAARRNRRRRAAQRANTSWTSRGAADPMTMGSRSRGRTNPSRVERAGARSPHARRSPRSIHTSPRRPVAGSRSSSTVDGRAESRFPRGVWTMTGVASARRARATAHARGGGSWRKSEITNTKVPTGGASGGARRAPIDRCRPSGGPDHTPFRKSPCEQRKVRGAARGQPRPVIVRVVDVAGSPARRSRSPRRLRRP